jgi:hypothetical protein
MSSVNLSVSETRLAAQFIVEHVVQGRDQWQAVVREHFGQRVGLHKMRETP